MMSNFRERNQNCFSVAKCLTISLILLGSGASAFATIAADRCSVSSLDFGAGPRNSINISPSNPATMDIGTVTADVAERWQTKSPNDARAGWWPSKGGDHTDPGNGYFLLMDIKPNSQNKVVYTNTFTSLEVGGNYSINLWLASAFYTSSPQVVVELMDDKGDVVAAVNKPALPNATSTDLSWQQVTLTFTASSSSQTIQLKEAGDTNASGNDLALDDISITHNCPPNVVPTAAPSITGTSQTGSVITGTYTYADNESDVENSVDTTYKFVTSSGANMVNSSDGMTVASGTTGGASGSVQYTLQSGDLNSYIYYCVTPAAQTGSSPGVEVCSAALGPITDKPIPPAPVTPNPVPTLGAWGLIWMSSILAVFGLMRSRRRSA